MDRRSLETIKNVTATELDNYNPECFDAIKNPDGTFNLVPLLWTNQEEFNDYAFGCGIPDNEFPTKTDEEWAEEAARDAAEDGKWERGPGAM